MGFLGKRKPFDLFLSFLNRPNLRVENLMDSDFVHVFEDERRKYNWLVDQDFKFKTM